MPGRGRTFDVVELESTCFHDVKMFISEETRRCVVANPPVHQTDVAKETQGLGLKSLGRSSCENRRWPRFAARRIF